MTGVDYSERMLGKSREEAKGMKDVTLLLIDAEHLEFPDNSLDYIAKTFVLCSIPNSMRALKEMRRVPEAFRLDDRHRVRAKQQPSYCLV